MLRITVHDQPEALTFQLEGRLGREARRRWRSAGKVP